MSDFGLAREGVTRTDSQKLPVKWTSPEALRDSVSDHTHLPHPSLNDHVLFDRKNSLINQMFGVSVSCCGRYTHMGVSLIPEW